MTEADVTARLRWQPQLTCLRFWPILSPENPTFVVLIETVRATPDDPIPELGDFNTKGVRREYSEGNGWRGERTAQWYPTEP